MTKRVYYVVSAEIKDVDGEVRYYESSAKRLCDCVSVYLLCTDTGCIVRRSVIVNGDSWTVKVDGVAEDSVIKFADGKASVDQTVISWSGYSSACISDNLLFLCVIGLLESYLVPFDDRCDLCLTGTYAMGRFRYELVPKGEYARRVLDTNIAFCSLLCCYFEVVARLQNRVTLAGVSANSREFFEIATRQLYKCFCEADLSDLPCTIGIQSLRLLVSRKTPVCGVFGICFEVTDTDIRTASNIEQPFLFIATRENGCEVLKSAVKASFPETIIQII